MKLLLALGSDETFNNVSHCLKPRGFDLIRYNQVIKAMDNIDEVDPSAIIISARDFPRHWKTMVQFVRIERSREDCPIILLRGENFPVEESTKASFLGVSGIVNEALDTQTEIEHLEEILGRFVSMGERRRNRRLTSELWHKFAFAFVHPAAKTLLTGRIKNISVGGLSFLPDNPPLLENIALNAELNECTLRVGDSMLSPICRLTRTGQIVTLEFVSFPDTEEDTIKDYIESLQQEDVNKDENGWIEVTII